MRCLHNDRLFAEYNRFVKEWAEAVQYLGNQAGVDDEQYQALLERVNKARARTGEAKAAYRKHVEEHGC